MPGAVPDAGRLALTVPPDNQGPGEGGKLLEGGTEDADPKPSQSPAPQANSALTQTPSTLPEARTRMKKAGFCLLFKKFSLFCVPVICRKRC